MARIWMIVAVLLALPGAASACGGTERCEVAKGYYLAFPPPDWDGESPLPLVVFYHGWNSSPEGMARNGALIEGVNRRGAMLVLPWAQTGYWRQIGEGRAEAGRDELSFTRAVMADLAARWPVDQRLVLASGFSRGGSMVWNLACYGAEMFSGFAPIAGGFWRSTPARCPAGPVNLRHIHGTGDRVVSFDRVGIYNSMPIPEGLAVLRAGNGADGEVDRRAVAGKLSCESWEGESGRVVSLCLHGGGHSIPAEWVGESFDWLAGLPAPALP
ncbi:MAG: hypothetical protein AAF568_03010 [Pseudomonadota bacterium]